MDASTEAGMLEIDHERTFLAGGDPVLKGTPTDYLSAVAAFGVKGGMSRAAAYRRAAIDFPALHIRYLASRVNDEHGRPRDATSAEQARYIAYEIEHRERAGHPLTESVVHELSAAIEALRKPIRAKAKQPDPPRRWGKTKLIRDFGAKDSTARRFLEPPDGVGLRTDYTDAEILARCDAITHGPALLELRDRLLAAIKKPA